MLYFDCRSRLIYIEHLNYIINSLLDIIIFIFYSIRLVVETFLVQAHIPVAVRLVRAGGDAGHLRSHILGVTMVAMQVKFLVRVVSYHYALWRRCLLIQYIFTDSYAIRKHRLLVKHFFKPWQEDNGLRVWLFRRHYFNLLFILI